MHVHSVSMKLGVLVLCAGLLLPTAVVQLTSPSLSFVVGQFSPVQDIAEPYCQFQGSCSSDISLQAMVEKAVGSPYCQFQDACPSIEV